MKTMGMTSSSVEDGLAELSGVSVCASPGCSIVLKSGQGKRTPLGDRQVLTCFQTRCVSWANDQAGLS